MESDLIHYNKGVLQGDSLSVLLFVLAVNPLSFLLKQRKGYFMGSANERNLDITHLFFVDDLKLYSSNIDQMTHLLDVATTFSKDIGMEFGQSKCSYMIAKRGKIVEAKDPLEVNGLRIYPLGLNDNYRYLGIDEALSYNGPLNKEKVATEYYKRVRKIWSSELSAYNKMIAHNSFAIPVLVYTFGVLTWSISELDEIDVKTRKLLTLTGNLHRNGDVDRIYMPRSEGGRGLKSVRTAFDIRLISLRQHIIQASDANPFMRKVHQHEGSGVIRIAEELLTSLDLNADPAIAPLECCKSAVKVIHKKRESSFISKVMHGYLAREMRKKPEIDFKTSLSCWSNRKMSSHFEGYIQAIQEQEIGTKYLIRKRLIQSGKEANIDDKCRLCRKHTEDVSHVIAGCERMATRFYLPLRHDEVARFLWNRLRKTHHAEGAFENNEYLSEQKEFIDTCESREYWWNIPVKTCTKVKHNRPDIIVWDHKAKTCFILEVACPLDVNVSLKETEKENIYGQLIRNMQMMYTEYTFTFAPIIVGASGYVTSNLKQHLNNVGFETKSIPSIIRQIQVLAISGTVKIAKTFMKFKS
jgi:hypothetical protein